MKKGWLRWIALPLALTGSAAMSHIFLIERGVHFRDSRVDFGVPPSRYARYRGNSMNEWPAWRPGTTYIAETDWEQWDARRLAEARRETRAAKGYSRASTQERNADYPGALRVYRRMYRSGLGSPGVLRERIELLKLAGHGQLEGLPQLLSATSIVTKRSVELPVQYDRRLAPFVLYHKGRFLDGALAQPSSPWADACLISEGRARLAAKVRHSDDDLHRADFALRKLLRDHPNSRFRANATGWLARIDYLKGRYDRAIKLYRQQRSLANTEAERRSAIDSIALCEEARERRFAVAAMRLRLYVSAPVKAKNDALADFQRVIWKFDGRDAKRFWGLLRDDAELLGAYIDYRNDFTRLTPDLLQLGARATAREMHGEAGGHVLAGLADSALRLRRLVMAERYARRALRHQRSGDDDALASYVLATARFRRGDNGRAYRLLHGILQEHPRSFLAAGVREQLAVVSERLGRLSEAMDLYQVMGYDHDVAYLADAKMTTAQLGAYLRRPKVPQSDVLTYTLGMRYLRTGDWARAESIFLRLGRAKRRYLTTIGGYEARWKTDQGGLQDPLATARAFRRLTSVVSGASGNERKAAAMLSLANYYYSHHDLLLYSPRLWNGTRAEAYSFSWNVKVATTEDGAAIRRHHDEHECFSHALRICREILRRYPNTRTAAHAAYRAACAGERLAHMDYYWRWRNRGEDLMAEAIRNMDRATKTHEPELRRKATKYARVFREYRAEDRKAFAYEGPLTREWNPQNWR